MIYVTKVLRKFSDVVNCSFPYCNSEQSWEVRGETLVNLAFVHVFGSYKKGVK